MSHHESNNNTIITTALPISSPPVNHHMLSAAAAATKLCHIVKSPDFEGYGFNLHSEKSNPGQYIGKVDPKSPAEKAGLKEGDRIIEVNGVIIANETHKQVVQRIKAIACEVRLMLIDVDGIKDGGVQPQPATDSSSCNKSSNMPKNKTTAAATTNGNIENKDAYQGTIQEMPGTSANISSISMISTKRTSNESNQSSSSHRKSNDTDKLPEKSVDVTDKAIIDDVSSHKDVKPYQLQANISVKNTTAAIVATNNINNNIMSSPVSSSVITTVLQETAVKSSGGATTNGNTTTTDSGGVNKAGSLQLPMTAAEMRAKLLAKKKYDPKNESVDLKKKFDIIQKL